MANINMWKSILCELLNCGYLDLDILDDADEDYVLGAIENCRVEDIPITLNAITDDMFACAQMEINNALDERIDVLSDYEADGNIDEDELKELEAIKKLNPDEDIAWYCNCLDTGIYIANDKYDVYKEYFGDLLDELEGKMGFEFGY